MVQLLLEADPALREAPAGAAPPRGDAGVRVLRRVRAPAGGSGGRPGDAGRRSSTPSSAGGSASSWTTRSATRPPRPRPCGTSSAFRRARLPDDDAIGLLLDPAQNALLGETMNVTTLSKLGRALQHASYTFRKRLSHTADSQDQRHRMTPASRPCLKAYLADEPDYVTPELVLADRGVRRAYDESMARTWEALARLRALGVERRRPCVPPPQRRLHPLHRVLRPPAPPPQAEVEALLQRPGGDLARQPRRGPPGRRGQSPSGRVPAAALHPPPPGRAHADLPRGQPLLRGAGLAARARGLAADHLTPRAANARGRPA